MRLLAFSGTTFVIVFSAIRFSSFVRLGIAMLRLLN